MSKLDQPLRLKHGLAAAVAIMAVSITGTAIAGGGGGGGGGDRLFYRENDQFVNANSQARAVSHCFPDTKVIGGGVATNAGFAGGGGIMINTSAPLDDGDRNRKEDDGWRARVDAFQNADNRNMVVYSICKG